MDGHDLAAADPWWYPGDYPGAAAPLAADAVEDDEFLDIEGLLGLAWEGGALEPPHAPPAEPPPSEDVMAAWLYPIVSGEDNAGAGPMVKSEPSAMTMGSLEMTDSKGKLPASDGMCDVKDTNVTSDPSERRKAASGGSNRTRSSRHSDTHNVTEKRRRCKISDRLRTLQQLVPGCEKSNQASTLEQTIQYMKSLQKQVEAMNGRTTQAVYPVMQTASAPAVAVPLGTAPASAAPWTVVAGGCVPLLPAGMAPFGAMLPYPPYHAVMLPAQAAAAPFYLPRPAASATPEGQSFVSTEHFSKDRGRRRRL
ncbi:putative transcription factor bHLH056 [Aegilops tauschii subsp. strangulata]|uniref:BHLH domain-containing protein n=1 Tax=Aegilops tauschii subsp. strangulata TaxID=200361 RepID=A0A453J1F4_AEGTS|nr:putative transcription factor bHLH056 [Aegilops tauschii subsp. strangulata]